MDFPARFFNVNIPVNRCTLRCHYCYIGQTFGYKDKINAGDETLRYSVEHMRKALTPERIGGVAIFNLCAHGETFLFNEIQEFVVMLLELGHYVSIVTNAVVSNPLKKLTMIPKDLRERLFIKASFHWLELKKRHLLNSFYDNIEMLKKAGISFTVELTVNDEAIPEIPEIMKSNMDNLGAYCHLVESRDNTNLTLPRLTKLNLKKHQSAWGQFQSALFNFQQRHYGEFQKSYCHAGEYSFSLVLQTGDLYQCDGVGYLCNIFENIEKPPKYESVGYKCQLPHCYIRYVYSALCDNYDSDSVPTYTEERDRICCDGTHWLTPFIREVFSHRISEWHDSYSDDKKLYIDCIMRWQYKREYPTEEESVRLADILKRRFAGSSVGLVLAPEWFESILKSAGVKLRFVVEGDGDTPSPGMKQRLKARFRYLYRKLRGDKTVKMTLFDVFPKCEIIICDYVNFPRLSKTIEERNGALMIVNIVEVIK